MLETASILGARGGGGGGLERLKKTYELLNLRALKFSPINKIHICQCMCKIFCVDFQRVHLYTVEILRALRIGIGLELISLFETPPPPPPGIYENLYEHK